MNRHKKTKLGFSIICFFLGFILGLGVASNYFVNDTPEFILPQAEVLYAPIIPDYNVTDLSSYLLVNTIDKHKITYVDKFMMFEALNDAYKYTGLSPAFIFAIIEFESSFNPKAVNKESGATGAMQILPSTGRFIINSLDYPDTLIYASVPDMLKETYPNIMMGSIYFKYLLDKNKNNFHKALQAYRGKSDTGYEERVLNRSREYTRFINEHSKIKTTKNKKKETVQEEA